MTTNSLLKIAGRRKPFRLFSALSVALMIAGCGGGASNEEATPGTTLNGVVVSSFSDAAPLAGASIAPYVGGASVFLDLNRNLNRDSDEPEGATTDAQGRFSLRVPPSVTNDQIEQALIVAQASGSDPLLPVPLAAPAAEFRDASVTPRAINSLTTMVAAEMSAEPGLDATRAQTRLRSALPELAERDLFADLTRIETGDPRVAAARLIAAKMLAERQSRLQAVAQKLQELPTEDDASTPDETAVVEALAQTPDAIDLKSLMTEIRESLPVVQEAVKDIVAEAGSGVAETIDALKARLEAATDARKTQREAEIETWRDEANQALAGGAPFPVVRPDDQPLPDAAVTRGRAASARDTIRNAERVTLIVVLKRDPNSPVSGRRDEAIARLPERARGNPDRTFERAIEGFTVTIPERIAEDFIERMLDNPKVDRVEIDEPLTRAVVSPQSPTPSWGLDRADARTDARLNNSFGWSASGAGVTAFIVDTGIAPSQAFASGQVQSGFSSINDGQNTFDCNGHGTHVAGTVASPVYGIAKSASLVPVRVLDCNGAGSTSTVLAGLDWILQQVAANPALALRSVVNLSLGGGASSTLDQAVEQLISSGVSVVVAAGNSADHACNYSPARVAGALTVAATDWNDTRASFSNYGTCVDLFAPGQSITSSSTSGGTLTLSGTSMAAPHVTGAVAQWLEALGGSNPATVTSALLSAATPNVVADALDSPNRLLFAQAQANGGGDTSTEPPAATRSVSIGALAGSGQRVTKNGNWRATVDVLVRDADGQAVAGVSVQGNFSVGGSGLTCTTGANGRCAMSSGTLSRKTSATNWTVQSMSGSGITYNAVANTASSVRISRP